MMQKKSLQSGFSLVETLVAITILLIVIVGPLAIVSSAANSTMFASDQVTAFLLAQEGAELVQKERDDYVIRGFLANTNAMYLADPWAAFTDTTSGFLRQCFVTVSNTNGCGLEINDDGSLGTVVNCTNNGCLLYYSSDPGIRSRFTHVATGNTLTDFTRTIKITAVGTNQARVVSQVTWFSGVTREAREVEVETFLFNVYD